MRKLQCLFLTVLFATVVASRAWGTVVFAPPQPLAAWLNDAVFFIGVGQVSDLTFDAASGTPSFNLTLLEAWKGTAPRTVSFPSWSQRYGLSEGQRMVYYAFNRKVTHSDRITYVNPEIVFRSGGRDCFRFTYASRAIPPQETLHVQFRGRAKEHDLTPILLLDEFRTAVRSILKRPAA